MLSGIADRIRHQFETAIELDPERTGGVVTRIPAPRSVVAKMRQLRALRDDARAIADGHRERVWQARDIHRDESRDFANFKAKFPRIEADDPALVARSERVEAAKLRLENAQAAAAPAHSRFQDLSRTVMRAEDYLLKSSMRAITIAAAPSSTDTRQPGSTNLSKIREEIETIQREIDAARAAPLPPDEAVKVWAEQLSRLRDAGRPDFGRTIWHGEYADLPFAPAVVTGNASHATVSSIDAAGLLAWTHFDQLLEAGTREINERAKSVGSGMPAEARAKALREGAARLLAAERREELTISKMEETGVTVARRDDADIRAVLGLADSMPTADEIERRG